MNLFQSLPFFAVVKFKLWKLHVTRGIETKTLNTLLEKSAE